jgi:signal transduction histidine kinase
VIESKAQREAIIEERQRIAREFHDTLEQELAGLSLRLDAATPRVADEKARDLLEQQQKLLQRLQTETRDFVWDLRDTTRQDAPLDDALRSLLDHLRNSTVILLSFHEEGKAPALPALVKHHLLRITREAVHNAIKYSGAKAIDVTLAAVDEQLRFTIADEGRGFDVASTSALNGHFGIRGMKERARKIGADLQVTSSPGKGTRVELVLALPAVPA